MVKAVECIRQLINVRTDLMRCFFFKGVLYGCTETCQLKHQVLLASIGSLQKLSSLKVSACFHNRLESDDPQWAEHKLESNASSYIMNDSDNNYLWNSPTAAYYGWPEQGAIPDDVLAHYDPSRISGLPAGAITNPGIDAIAAALNPDQEYLDEGYYFFVTGNPNGDHPGEYFYAKTADEHHQNCIIAGWG